MADGWESATVYEAVINPRRPSATRFACTNERARPRNMVPIFNKLYLITRSKQMRLVITLPIIIVILIINDDRVMITNNGKVMKLIMITIVITRIRH